MWAVGAIVVVVLALVACMGFCIYKKCFNKGKKPKKVRERKGGRGRRKKEAEGEEGEEKKVRQHAVVVGLPETNIQRLGYLLLFVAPALTRSQASISWTSSIVPCLHRV